MKFEFDNTYARELIGFYSRGEAEKVTAPQLVKLNVELAEELGLDAAALNGELGAQIFSGNVEPEDAEVLAMAYAGHQFGSFVPQLGDGRAVLLGEVIDRKGQRRDIQLKGSGRTPFSRGGDGKAGLGPVLREYIMGEAMYGLGVPTTRALAAVTTGQPVFRNGMLPGAVLTRVASSHIRVGTFQFFAARKDSERVQRLADYAIARHYPELVGVEDRYAKFLEAVCERQASLIAQWMHIGFIHGVMNTDNMAISGETIDYGPCAFLDTYGESVVFSSIDQFGRYAYGQQPIIARWDLARLAECLLELIDSDEKRAVERALAIVNGFTDRYEHYWMAGMRRKLGLVGEQDGDVAIATGWMAAMEGNGVDFTRAFRGLSRGTARELFGRVEDFDRWYGPWRERSSDVAMMDAANPVYIARNHQVEAAIEAAVERKDFAPFEKLLEVLGRPFEEREGLAEYAVAGPESAEPYRTFCGT